MALALLYGFTPKAGADDWLQPADWGNTAHVFKRNVVTPGSPPNCRFELDDFEVPADTYEIIGISFWMNKAFGCHFPTYFMYDDNGQPGDWFADRTSWSFDLINEGTDLNGNPVVRYDYDFSADPVAVTPGDTYWIALSSPPCPGHYDWGLHNTPLLNGWGSNAKWCPEGTGLTPTPPYTNLDYPAGHTWYGQQVDVAFEIRFAGPVEPLDADFFGSPLTGVAPHNVDFTSEVTGGVEPYDYAWDLDGDGEFDDAFVANPIYIYVDLGRYDVSLRVTDSQLEEVTVTKERYIQVNEAGTQSGCISNANPDSVWFLFGDTVTESCTFANGMDRPTGQTGHGLIVGADDITIDGAGYCLDGVVKNCIAGEDYDAGIYSVAHSEVTINDLEIKNFCHGIYLAGDPGSGVPADGCTVECCDIHDNGVNESEVRTGGIWQNNVFNSFIRNCKVYKNEGDPTASSPPGGFGIYLCFGEDNEWSGNEVYENRKAGMFFRGMPKGTWVHHNYAHDNNFGGIRGMCMNTEGSLVEYNYCSDDNVGPGIMFGGPGGQDAEPNIARYNICRENETYGIEFSRGIISDKGECYENTACGNLGGYDIYVKPGVTIPGNCNTCDTTHNYNDQGATGCMYDCSTVVDSDGDGVRDYSYPGSGLKIDNCCLTPNPDQRDTNGDGYGNICDCDLDNNGVVGMSDFNIFRDDWLQHGFCLDSDFDGNGYVGMADFSIFHGRWQTYAPFDYCPPEGVTSYLTVDMELYICWGAGHLHPMIEQIDEYVCEQGIPACAPIGPNCLPEEVAEQLVEESPAEAWYITDEPVGVIVPCP
jgi:PKD repeat protein